jgi:hypothetical protein
MLIVPLFLASSTVVLALTQILPEAVVEAHTTVCA